MGNISGVRSGRRKKNKSLFLAENSKSL